MKKHNFSLFFKINGNIWGHLKTFQTKIKAQLPLAPIVVFSLVSHNESVCAEFLENCPIDDYNAILGAFLKLIKAEIEDFKDRPSFWNELSTRCSAAKSVSCDSSAASFRICASRNGCLFISNLSTKKQADRQIFYSWVLNLDRFLWTGFFRAVFSTGR